MSTVAATRESERTRRLCAVLGHELRNPLASAMTSVSLVAAMLDSADPRMSHLQQATRDLERMSSLLSAYLEFGRTGHGARRSIDLAEVVRAVATRNVCTDVAVKSDAVRINGDADLLGRALENIIENAFDAGATEATIELDARDGAAVIEIRDDGPGVPVDLQENLFEPFVSGRGSSGLGLAVARSVVESQGGRISLDEPKQRRGGALFRIILPLEDVASERLAALSN